MRRVGIKMKEKVGMKRRAVKMTVKRAKKAMRKVMMVRMKMRVKTSRRMLTLTWKNLMVKRSLVNQTKRTNTTPKWKK